MVCYSRSSVSEGKVTFPSNADDSKVPIQRYTESRQRYTELKCPALEKSCAKCGKTGHFAKMCKIKNEYK